MRAFVDEVTETSALPACRVPFGSHAMRVFRPLSYTSPKLETTRSADLLSERHSSEICPMHSPG